MEPDNNLKVRIKNFLKKSRSIVRIYQPIKFLHITSFKDLLSLVSNLGKTRLMITVRPYTMMDYPPLSILYESALRFETANKSGSFVECGVRNGGSAAVIAAAARGNSNRHTWLFDSWEGFPEPDEIDIACDEKRAEKGGCLGYEERVKELIFDRLKLDSTRVHLVKGWFADTLPKTEIGPIALLHLHCDLYESVRGCLEQLYDNVIIGGRIFIADYGYYKGSTKAVDEFLKHRGIVADLTELGIYGVYFDKKS